MTDRNDEEPLVTTADLVEEAYYWVRIRTMTDIVGDYTISRPVISRWSLGTFHGAGSGRTFDPNRIAAISDPIVELPMMEFMP